ncbi:hypothetical protein [Desulfoluna limicola]|uniref:hypothetical protein n=1 Tax=Desulfoluna limicola TaxID=2810562 RepID=UPI001F267F1B|nr:hypothetical protein [Desulfoluna limicola]
MAPVEAITAGTRPTPHGKKPVKTETAIPKKHAKRSRPEITLVGIIPPSLSCNYSIRKNKQSFSNQQQKSITSIQRSTPVWTFPHRPSSKPYLPPMTQQDQSKYLST